MILLRSVLQRIVAIVLVVTSVATTVSCASTASSKDSFSEGWRNGWVKRIVPRSEINANESNWNRCVTKTAQEERATQYAIVAYPYLRSVHYRLFAIAPQTVLAVGAKVRVNIRDCSRDLVLRS